MVMILWIGTFGLICGAMKVGTLDTFFGNLAYAYRDNGVPYSFMVTWVRTGIVKPKVTRQRKCRTFSARENWVRTGSTRREKMTTQM